MAESSLGGFPVDAPAVIHVETHTFIVIAHQRSYPALAQEIDHLVRVGAVPDQVAEAVDCIRGLCLDLFSYRLERVDIGVNVGEERDLL